MKIERVYEKPIGRERRGETWWYASARHYDGFSNRYVRSTGCGKTKAEAKKELLCQMGRCDMKHAKKYKPNYEDVI